MSICNHHKVAVLLATFALVVGAATVSTAAGKPPAQALPAGHYALDKAHSTITFKVSHLGFSFYTASFSRFDATFDGDPVHPAKAALSAAIDATSLTLPTPPEGFLKELLGPQWLNAGAHPQMTYQSRRITSSGKNTARVIGDFTLNGTTVSVPLAVTFNGGYRGVAGMDPNARAGYSAHGTLIRSEFGVKAGIPAKGTTMGVGDRVDFVIEAEFIGPPLAASASP